MPDVCNSFAIRALAVAVGLAVAVAPAKACDERGCFGGVQGWGGIFRDNRDPGWFPTYVAVSGWDRGNIWVIERPPVLLYTHAPAARPQMQAVRVKTRRRHRRASLSSNLACAAQRPCFCCH